MKVVATSLPKRLLERPYTARFRAQDAERRKVMISGQSFVNFVNPSSNTRFLFFVYIMLTVEII